EILQWYLSHSEPSRGRKATSSCVVSRRQVGGVTGLQFSPGSEGGARLIPREQISEEDEALYEKVCQESSGRWSVWIPAAG
ncbi:hypothetical protein AAFF_G00198860, partial [Aldrovandia affinis]